MSSLKKSEHTFWRSIEQWTADSFLADEVATEFPQLDSAIARHDRRSFVKLLGASMALAGLTSTGCRRWPVEEIRPHTARPEGTSPGEFTFYATLFEFNGAAYGVLAKSFDGRPIKIEGNPSHPASRGAASSWAQASVLDLYDPDRSRSILYRGRLDSAREEAKISVVAGSIPTEQLEATWKPASQDIQWRQFASQTKELFRKIRQQQGSGLALLLRPTSSPTEQRLVRKLRKELPKARWFAYCPWHRDAHWHAGRKVFQRPVRTVYDLTEADYVVSVECDLLGTEPGHIQHATDWAEGRRSVDHGRMNRIVCLESTWTTTGSIADTRIPLKPSDCELAIEWLAARIGIAKTASPDLPLELQSKLEDISIELQKSGTRGLITGGPGLSSRSLQVIHAINIAMGNTGKAVKYVEEPSTEWAPDGFVESIGELSRLLQGNVVQTLLILGGNPAYDGPADAPLDLTSTFQRPLVSIYLGTHDNETSQLCTWHVPMSHSLECWGDGLSWDGIYTLQQPLIEPLFCGKSILELLAFLSGQESPDARVEIRQTFDELFADSGNRGWEQALHDGCVQTCVLPTVALPNPPINLNSDHPSRQSTVAEAGSFELRFLPDNRIFDGSFSNNAWLQELPDPLTKLTWDNAVLISKADAVRLGIENGTVVRLMDQIELPAMIMPGQSAGCIAVTLGFGRRHSGRIGNDIGCDVFPIRTSPNQFVIQSCSVAATSKALEIATTQMHHVLPSIADVALKHRLGNKGQPGHLVHECLFEDYVDDHHAVHGEQHAVHGAPLFDPPHQFDTPHRWAMAIDLNSCIGCNGCVIACQAENNIPVVGKQNVLANREMHWIRIDRYFKGDVADPDIVHVPTTCAHCENAPCEQVCPVAATVHDAEGTNAMVYNRCIGTRYCANNCPYKVRRFNYFDFHASDPREPSKPYLGIPDSQQEKEVSTLKRMVHNPDVTVRMRGVMEKCTYCIQRIANARIAAKNENAQGLRESEILRDGEFQTACQATCPTQAIVFGDLNNPDSAVSKARSQVRSYEMLAELNLGARTTYLAKVRNRRS